MTEKRFSYNVNKNIIQCDGKFVAYVNCVDGVRIANKLNVFQKENEQLEKENLDLSEELDYYKAKCASLETGYIKAQDEGWRLEKSQIEFADELGRVIDENEQLKMENNSLKLLIQSTSDQRDEFHRGARENANRVGKLEKENEQLKQSNQKLNDELQETMGYLALKSGVEKENEQLKHKLKSLNDNFNHLKRLFSETEEPISDELLAEYSRIVVEDLDDR